MIAKILNFFTQAYQFEEAIVLRKARLLVKASLLTSMFSLSYIWLSVVFEYPKGVYLMVFNVLGFLFLPFLMRLRVPINRIGNLYVLIGAVAVTTLTWFSGGMWSAIYPWIISIPVLALLVVNRLSGLIWGAVAFLVMILIGLLTVEGYDFPVEYNTELKPIWYFSVIPGLLLIILVVSLVFEATQTRALHEVEGQYILLENQKETISRQSERLKQLIDEKNHIIRILAHDLKNPLGNIHMLCEVIRKKQNSEDMKHFIDLMEKASKNSLMLVDKVLAIGELENNNRIVQLKPVVIGEVLEEVVASFNETANLKNIQIELINDAGDAKVLADKICLIQVFENLISNSVKFSKKGQPVTIELKEQVDELIINIMDRGPGVLLEDQNKLFKEFSRLSAQPTGGESSSGLGLSLVKRYIDQMNGKVGYKNREGGGSVFYVVLEKNKDRESIVL